MVYLGSPTQFVDQSLHRRNSEPTPIGEPWPSGQANLEKST